MKFVENCQRTMSIPISFFSSILTSWESTPSFHLQLISNSYVYLLVSLVPPPLSLSLSILRYALTLDDFND